MSRSGAQHRRMASGDAHINDGDTVPPHRCERLRQRGSKRRGSLDRPQAKAALGARQRGDVDVRVAHCLADPPVRSRPTALGICRWVASE